MRNITYSVSKTFFFFFKICYLGSRATRILPGVFVRGSPLEMQQDISGSSRVERRVTFGDWDVHELGRTPGSS